MTNNNQEEKCKMCEAYAYFSKLKKTNMGTEEAFHNAVDFLMEGIMDDLIDEIADEAYEEGFNKGFIQAHKAIGNKLIDSGYKLEELMDEDKCCCNCDCEDDQCELDAEDK